MAQADLDFHQQICKMSHNTLYGNSYTLAREAIYQYLLNIIKFRHDDWKSKSVPAKQVIGYNIHRDLCDAIRNKQREKCKQIYLTMIDHDMEL
ncbi:FCD domain-containing protein [Clostridium sp. OS1-26]|uniref:FCD domain-containing protein n=1 Tax=Clostridium sp. OS1-26 TaxID=3070681 RepID=UPI0027E063D9|nr:FCD domain-containing protein [Clostridium sp. OS1-26]WML34363.1 FCD domain-containing protein [Clostridium sp. OS1-26]